MAKKTSGSKSVDKLADLIHGIRFAMMTTACGDGSLRSRPMATQEAPFDGTLWFFTDDHSAKVEEIDRDRHVSLSYADPGNNTYVSISGRASLNKDRNRMRGLWNPLYQAWFPKGLNDPHLALLEVTVDRAEYWDSPGSKVTQLVGFLKAKVTGKPADDLTENKKITLSGRRGGSGRGSEGGGASRDGGGGRGGRSGSGVSGGAKGRRPAARRGARR